VNTFLPWIPLLAVLPVLGVSAVGAIGIGLIVALAGGAGVGFALLKMRAGAVQKEKDALVAEGRNEAERIVKDAKVEAKEELLRIRSDFEKETQETRQELRQLQRQIAKREDAVERETQAAEKKQRYLEGLENDLSERLRKAAAQEKQLEELISKEKDTLFSISNMGRDEAVELLLKRLEKEVEREADQMVRRAVERAREQADDKAREIVVEAIGRCAVEHTADSVVSAIDIPSDDMKGRIIGREGRNIRAFEKATGIDVIVDDTPGVIVVSGFDGVRREIARRSMEKLIKDGRIHPARIEDLVNKCGKEVMDLIKQTGKQVADDLDVRGLKAGEIECLGRLKFRTSYGQNVLQHSIESARLCAAIAGELKLDTVLARRIGLLHDLGKSVDHEVEGGHPEIGADLARRFDEKPVVVNAIAAHHEGCPAESIYAVIVQAADAISASRPGARRESLERYIKRLQKLEDIAGGFNGVETAYAIQAGREVRVIVAADRVADNRLGSLAREVANEIENELAYPGEIKVTVLRETRSVEYAR
jgi:ribonuclease Y